ncbi:hypothetical protein ACT3CD_07480 [Geofilum sp. OHC36d9]|uniref:hypothetical protein n=1 Tax=Geofilum sp. OHC36d9 TaxID=3458413 RepID=UPI00403345EE
MTQNRSHKIKKNYQSPLIVEVGIDNYSTLLAQSTPPVEPETSSLPSDSKKKLFPDSPTTDDPFGGSSPDYR